MKKSVIVFTAFILMSPLLIMAQAPQLFNYQGIAHGSSGPLINQEIGIKINIIENTPNGSILYSERQVDTTNKYGLYNVAIGAGTPLNSTSWGAIDWTSGDKFINISIDPNGGTTYANLGTTQLLSVPYAIYAGSAAIDSNAWSKNGNIADTAAFIGTLNSSDIRFKRNGNDIGRIGFTNISFGYQALNRSTTGSENNAFGYKSMASNTTGRSNNSFGRENMFNNTTGSYNNSFGASTLKSNTTGSYNNAIGRLALYSNTTGDKNSALGTEALYYNSTGTRNTASGYRSLRGNTTGNNNTGIGYNAGRSNIDGSYLTMVGANSNVVDTNYTYSGAFGYSSRISASKQYRIGSMTINAPTSIGGKVSWTTTSDGRFKTDVKEDVVGLAFILQLRPVTYHFDNKKIEDFIGIDRTVEDGEETTARDTVIYNGFIAQEVEATAKKLGFDFHGVDQPKNDKDYYGLRYAEFVVPLVKAVQEQQEVIEKQNERIDKLETMLQRLLDEKE